MGTRVRNTQNYDYEYYSDFSQLFFIKCCVVLHLQATKMSWDEHKRVHVLRKAHIRWMLTCSKSEMNKEEEDFGKTDMIYRLVQRVENMKQQQKWRWVRRSARLWWMYLDKQQQRWGMTDSQQLRTWGRDWIDVLSCAPEGPAPLPHRRKSSENAPLPGSHRWTITCPSSPRLPPPPPRGPVCPHHPATRLICRAGTSSCYKFQTSHAYAAWHSEVWKHLHHLCIQRQMFSD